MFHNKVKNLKNQSITQKLVTLTKSILVFSLILTFSSGCDKVQPVNSGEGIVAGIYTGPGVWDPSVRAMFAALRSFGLPVDSVSASMIVHGDLSRFIMVVFPGGDPHRYSEDLGPIGRGEMRLFVARGGGFLGVGGGAAVADSDSGDWPGLKLFAGDADWPIDVIRPHPEYTLTHVDLFDPQHPIAHAVRDRYYTLYRWGPEFGFHAADVIFAYEITGSPAAVAFEYGTGRVFLAGFHPEIEENSDRDSTDFGSELDDPESEWELLQSAVQYCLWEI